MNAERWAQINAVFVEAISLPPDQISGFLLRACQGDAELKRAVDALLQGHADAERQATQSALSDITRLDDDAATADVGLRIGPYQTLRELGRGGMGTVFLAVRADDAFRKRVALKLVKRGMDSDEILRRFRYERQIVAGLDHPNIARLLDGGTAPDGRPYFVMEYVEGQPLTEFCDNRKLDIPARLTLFATVCRSVHYAHQNLVVHRDLKPGNILITADGTPKLLDFGIAKLLNPELQNLTIDPTSPVLRLMTPEYASPEQVRGEPITTASDVYSLGVLLYELLTGGKPYQLGSASLSEIARAVCEVEPERPSAAVTDAGRPRRGLKGDVDTIVLKAMRKEPGRRYASAEQLAEDIARHLDGRPVRAQRDTVGYRVTKFVKRHRVGVATSAAVVALLIGSVVALLVQSARIATERDAAQQTSTFLIDLFRNADPYQLNAAAPMTVRDLIDAASKRLETELETQPEVRGRLLGTIGGVYLRMSVNDKATPLLEESVETLKRHVDPRDPHLLRSRSNLAEVWLRRRDYDRAIAEHRDIVRLWRESLPRSPELVESLNDLGITIAMRHWGEVASPDFDEAERVLQEALALGRQVLAPDDLGHARTLANLARLRQGRGDSTAAEPYMVQSVEALKRGRGDKHPEVARVLGMLGQMQMDLAMFERAQATLGESRKIYEHLFPDGHGELGLVLHLLAEADTGRAMWMEAEAHGRQARAIFTRLRGPMGQGVELPDMILGIALWAQGRLVEAAHLVEESYALQRDPSADKLQALMALTLVAIMRQDRADPAGALAMLRDAAQRLENLGGKLDLAATWLAFAYGSALMDTGAIADAEPYLTAAHREFKGGANPWMAALAGAERARCLTAMGRIDDGGALYAEAAPILHSAFGASHPRVRRIDAAFSRAVPRAGSGKDAISARAPSR
jgi:serine/threonine-protein kinase